VESLSQFIHSLSSDDLLLDILFVLIGASTLALLGLCVGLLVNGAADPLLYRLTRFCKSWLFRLGFRQRPRPSAQNRQFRSVTRR
jgi:hypothetical protein